MSTNPQKYRVLSEDARRRIGDAHRGKKRVFSDEHRANLSKSCKGRKNTPEHTKNNRQAVLNSPNFIANPDGPTDRMRRRENLLLLTQTCSICGVVPESTSKLCFDTSEGYDRLVCRSCTSRRRNLSRGTGWKKSTSSVTFPTRLYDEWSLKVKERDGFTCQDCGERDRSKLVSHHIIHCTEDFNPLNIDLNNGVTVCRSCHNYRHPERIQKAVEASREKYSRLKNNSTT